MGRNLAFIEEEAIQKAMNVFWEKGYNGASMRDLATAMKINSSSLYNTIGDKKQLFLKCIKQYTDARMNEVRAQVEKSDDPFRSIADIIKGSAKTITQSKQSCLSIKTAFELGMEDEQVRKVVKQHDDEFLGFLKELIKEAQKADKIKAHHDAGMLTDFIFNSFTGWHESYIIHKNPLKITQMADYLIEIIQR